MGVVNLTPNSFSDGGDSNHPLSFKKKVQELIENGAEILDLGAESTAPMNQAISSEEEILRFEQILLPNLAWLSSLSIGAITLDSYQTDTIKWLYPKLKGHYLGPIYWNDVSGVLDQDTLDTLESFPKLNYILGHNFVTEKEQTNNHLNFVNSLQENDFLALMIEFFENQLEILSNTSSRNIWLDPGFGFAKTREQNLWLMAHLPDLVSEFPPDFKWLIGISRKSFLRPLGVTLLDCLNFVEEKQRQQFNIWQSQLPQTQIIARVHNPKIISLTM